MRRSLIVLGSVALAVPVLVAPLDQAGAGSADAARVRLVGSMPLLPVGVIPSAPVPPDERVEIQVHLLLRDQAGADALALAVATPGNPLRGRYLTPQQFRARFSPTEATVAKVSGWLTSQDLTVTGVPANRFYVAAAGTAAQVEAAFSTALATVEVNGGQRRVNTAEPALPADLASSVAGITGLTQVFAHPTRVGGRDELPGGGSTEATADAADTAGRAPAAAPPAPGFRNADPCSASWGEQPATEVPRYGSGYPDPLPWAPCGWTPPELRQAYGLDAVVARGIDGRGVTVAVVDAYASPTILDDASTYASRHDPDHPLDPSQFVEHNFQPERLQGECGIQGWYGEETLDVEAVHATAPKADILYVGARSCDSSDMGEAVAEIVDGHRADIVTNSYGFRGELLPAAVIDATVRVHTQAAIQGIGLYYATGDAGDYGNDASYGGPAPSAPFPASSPWATAVGGTSLGIDAGGQVAVEQGWTTGVSTLDLASGTFLPGGKGDFLYGAGGGASRLFEQPSYQAGVVPNRIAESIGVPPRRVVPDVGMVGDPNTGMLIGQTQTFPEGVSYDEYRIGGTSLSAPLFAGVMALADQRAGYHHGFANPWLYSLAGTDAFRDVTSGDRTAVVRRNFVNGTDDSAGFTQPTVRTFDADLQTLRTRPGYDTLTGLGAPNGNSFVNAGVIARGPATAQP